MKNKIEFNLSMNLNSSYTKLNFYRQIKTRLTISRLYIIHHNQSINTNESKREGSVGN